MVLCLACADCASVEDSPYALRSIFQALAKPQGSQKHLVRSSRLSRPLSSLCDGVAPKSLLITSASTDSTDMLQALQACLSCKLSS